MRAGKKPAPPPVEDGDREHFLRAMAEVHRLPPPPRALSRPAAPPALARQRLADERAALAQSRAAAEFALPEDGLESEPEQSFLRAGLRADTLRRLRRRYWSIQSELDLHGHTSEEARLALGAFLARCQHAGWRCVRVIHGKGLSSPGREPVLKGRVRRWLQRCDAVLAYCEAAPVDGGSGAVLILLQAAKRSGS